MREIIEPAAVEPTSAGTLGDLPGMIARETPDGAVLHIRPGGLLDRPAGPADAAPADGAPKDSAPADVAPADAQIQDAPSRRPADAATEPSNGSPSGSAGEWRDVSAVEFDRAVTRLAKGLLAAGIGRGDRVAIMCRTRYEWTIADFAIWAAGAVTVPIYETSSAEQVQWIGADSGTKAIIVETPDHAATVASVRESLPDLMHVWQIDAGSLDEVSTAGDELPDSVLLDARAGLDRTSVATIIYTSGTTGRPKGCQLTHGNFLDLSENTVEVLGDVVAVPGASTLLFLPLAHVFARFIQVLCVVSRARLAHSHDIKALLPDLAAVQPTFVLAVPRVFEKIYNSAEQKAEAAGRGKIFHRAVNTAIVWSEAQDTGGASLGVRVQHALFDRLVYGTLRQAMGGRVQYAVSGGAPLGTRLGHFFRGIGVTVLEGYGLTETTAPATVNRPALVKIGTVGYPLPGVGIRIADDGEVQIRGNNVFTAYHGNTDATAEAIHDGWFHTGDLGSLDDDGYLRITGRKKEMLVTAGGKNVAPAVLEDRLRAHPLVSQTIVVGDQRPFIAALVTLDEDMFPGWAAQHDAGDLSFEDAPHDPRIIAAVQAAVDRANQAVSRAEAIRKFVIIGGDFTEENGTLTPSLKLKRAVIMRDYADQIDELYTSNDRT